VVSSYFETDWMSFDIKSVSIPVVLDIKSLYYSILRAIIPLVSRQNETMDELVSRVESLGIIEREAAKAGMVAVFTGIRNQTVTKGINPEVKLKDSGIDWLGEIPEHWEDKKVKVCWRIHNWTI